MIYNHLQQIQAVPRPWRMILYQFILLMLLMTLSFLPSARSQLIERQVINSLGSHSAFASQSAGEAVIFTRSGASIIATQGFQQTQLPKTISISEFTVDRSGISLYPNPTTSSVNIAYKPGQGSAHQLQLTLYTSSGQLVKSKTIILDSAREIYVLDMNFLSEGIYHLYLSNSSFQSNHKIIKTN